MIEPGLGPRVHRDSLVASGRRRIGAEQEWLEVRSIKPIHSAAHDQQLLGRQEGREMIAPRIGLPIA